MRDRVKDWMRRPAIVAMVAVWLVLLSGGLGWWFGVHSRELDAPDINDFHVEAFEHIPESAHILFSVDAGWFVQELIQTNLGMLPIESDPDELMDELSDISKEYIGVDLMEARRAIGWASASGAAAMWFEGDFDGDLIAERTTNHNGTEVVELSLGLYAALASDGLVVGNLDGVEQMIDLEKGDVDPISQSARAEKHRVVLDEVDDGFMVLSIDLAYFGEIKGPYAGLDAAAVVLATDGALYTAITGSRGALENVVDLIDQTKGKMKQALDTARDMAKIGESGAGMMLAAFGRAKVEDLFAAFDIEQDGGLLTITAEGPYGLSAVYFLGLGAVATQGVMAPLLFSTF